jgi:hypothetical protein
VPTFWQLNVLVALLLTACSFTPPKVLSSKPLASRIPQGAVSSKPAEGTGMGTSRICIVQSPHGDADFLDAYRKTLSDKGYDVRVVTKTPPASQCPLTSRFAVLWIPTLLDHTFYAEIRIFRHGDLVAWARTQPQKKAIIDPEFTKSAVTPLVDRLLPEFINDFRSVDQLSESSVQLPRGQFVSLLNGWSGHSIEAGVELHTTPIPRQRPRTFKLVVDQERLTKDAMGTLGRALQKQGIEVRNQSEKTVTLRIRDVRIIGSQHFGGAQILLEARFGDGSVAFVPADGPVSGTNVWGDLWGRMRNGIEQAVLQASQDLVEDEAFLAYMNR